MHRAVVVDVSPSAAARPGKSRHTGMGHRRVRVSSRGARFPARRRVHFWGTHGRAGSAGKNAWSSCDPAALCFARPCGSDSDKQNGSFHFHAVLLACRLGHPSFSNGQGGTYRHGPVPCAARESTLNTPMRPCHRSKRAGPTSRHVGWFCRHLPDHSRRYGHTAGKEWITFAHMATGGVRTRRRHFPSLPSPSCSLYVKIVMIFDFLIFIFNRSFYLFFYKYHN